MKHKIKEIENFNNKGQYHGYQEWYWSNELWVRVKYHNGNEIGYEEIHFPKTNTFYIR